ncbi:MAG: S-adenosylmethionine-dependent methyltransferase [Erythrobacter sp.]|nr:MAG: S-adenosylmethionine-dependent methyltransferase [Erythrobacter sp.]
MGLKDWYEARIMPRLITCACSQPQVMKRRAEVVPRAPAAMSLSWAAGAGSTRLSMIRRRSPPMPGSTRTPACSMARAQQHSARGWAADIREGRGEAIPFADASFDCVVCTFTLCSVEDPAQVMRELRRILRPGGEVLFLEHGRAPDAGVRRWQERIEPLWKRLAGGCHLTRPIASALAHAGFVVERLEEGYTPKAPRIAGWMEWGVARKAG